MKIFKKGILFSALVCFIAWGVPGLVLSQLSSQGAEKAFTELSPSKEHKKINKDIVDLLRHRHYLKVTIDDHLSSKVLYRFLDELDPSHSYFYARDIKEFEVKYRFKLDEAFKNKDLTPGFDIFNRYQQRVIERLTDMVERLELGLDNIKFDV